MKYVKSCIRQFANRLDIEPSRKAAASVQQLILMNQYRVMSRNEASPLRFEDVGLHVWSQNEEDGILLFIFALIGTLHRTTVEFCAGDGIECNSANLLINHHWTGLLCDGDQKKVEQAKQFYNKLPETWCWPPTVVNRWLTCENVNSVLKQNNMTGEVDLLSIDVDGIDYWLWHSITQISPRVVVIECNHLCGPERSVTVPYNPDFKAEFSAAGSDYAGASLNALISLGRQKGYRFIGTNRFCTNAFFLRENIPHPWLPEVSANTCFWHPRTQWGMRHRWPKVEKKEWQCV